MKRWLTTFRRHPLLATAFALALLVTLFFGARTVAFAIYWNDPAHQDQPIAGWMPPRYIAHSWGVPPEVVARALDLAPEQAGRRVPLDVLARERGVSVAELAARLEAAIIAYRAGAAGAAND